MNINRYMIKGVAFFLFIGLYFIPAKSQNKDSVQFWYFKQYPYNEVLDYLGNPDTILFCHYPLRRYEEENAPIAINLYAYKKYGEWWATSLISFRDRKYRQYWRLTKTMWVQTDLTEKLNEVATEAKNIDYSEDYTTIHTSVYIKSGSEVTKWLIGNIRDLFYNEPAFSYFFTVALLESYNIEFVKTYHE